MKITIKKDSLVSVIIPVYNTSKYLIRALDSVMSQTYTNLEIIVINDGSTDNSLKVIKSLATIDDRIFLINQLNMGLSSARNSGIENSRGDFIVFLDSDDYFDRKFVEEMISVHQKYGCDVVSCRSLNVNEEGKLIDMMKEDDKIIKYNFSQSIMALKEQKNIRFEVWNKLFTRKVIGETRFKEKQVFEDIYFDREVFSKMNKMIHINKNLHFYTKERAGNTNSYFNKNKLSIFREIDDFSDLLISRKMFKESKVLNYIAIRFVLNFYVDCYQKGINEHNDILASKFNLYYSKIGLLKSMLNPGVFMFKISPKLYLHFLRIRKKI